MSAIGGAVVGYDQAKKIFDKLVASKKSGGYLDVSAGATGMSYTASKDVGQSTGLSLQLSTPINEDECERKLQDDSWGAQLKANGERRALIVVAGTMTSANKKCCKVNVPAHWTEAIDYFGDVTIDGEQIGDDFYAFDIIRIGDKDLHTLPFAARYLQLSKLFHGREGRPSWFKLLEAQVTTATKRSLFEHVKKNNLEGLVFQRLAGTYRAGRNSDSLKFKFVDSATCVVYALNSQRSVVVGLFDVAGELKPFGNVTIPPNHDIPAVGEFIEVEFLYFTGRAFEQPQYLGRRPDQDKADAQVDQITRTKPALIDEAVAA